MKTSWSYNNAITTSIESELSDFQTEHLKPDTIFKMHEQQTRMDPSGFSVATLS